MDEAPRVFIRDQAYAWLPGSIVLIKEGKAVVRIELPSDWHSSTVLCQGSGLEEIEDALAAAANGGGSEDEDDDDQGRKTPNVFRSVSLAAYPNGQLPLQNKCGQQSDMADLPHLHEAAMLYNLKERNSLQKPYTRVRDVIVAVNPFSRIDELYSLQMQQLYANKFVWTQDKDKPLGAEKKEDPPSLSANEHLEPHIYEISCLAYRGVAVDNQDQTILVTGESNSGKTETTKILLEHLATMEFVSPDMQMEIPGSNLEIVNKVMESSVVLEAFGNAKTRRNDNSSRFGKLMQLQFTTGLDLDDDDSGSIPTCSLVGSKCTTYLLEKTRVASHAVGERNFNIFYQLFAAPVGVKGALWPSFASRKPTDFSYLAQFGECDLESLDDANQWNDTVNALQVFGIEGELLYTLMRALAIVLQLGNLKFGEKHGIDGERQTEVTSTEELKILCDMIGIEEEDLEKALTSRSIKTNFEELRTPLQPLFAKESTDALAKEIYARIFGYIVRHLNDQMQPRKEDDVCGTIALVDIYGFERHAVNRFEQLCINYANEQLQQKYVADNFRILKQEYDQEGIDIFDFSLVDNSDVLDLLDGRTGVFVALQAECVRPMASDESFVQKVKRFNGSHPRLINEKLHSTTEFGIRHFAGPVTYDATMFVDRNVDRVSEELMSWAATTSNSLIRDELQRSSTNKNTAVQMGESQSKVPGMTLIEKFSTELRDLLVDMQGTKTRYIRCIIPNDSMAPGVTNHLKTLRQLEYAGLMTSVALTRENLPDSLSYKTLLSRFSCLLTKSDQAKLNDMELSDQIVYMLTNLFLPTLQGEDGGAPSMPFACGKTKAYLRAGALDHLETLRYRFLLVRAVLIQSQIRRWQERRKYLRQRRGATLLQGVFRECLVKKRRRQRDEAARLLARKQHLLVEKRELAARKKKREEAVAARAIQSRWRTRCARARYKRLVSTVTIIQRRFRAKAICERLNASATIIQRRFRGKAGYERLIASATIIQRKVRAKARHKRRVTSAATIIQRSVRSRQSLREQPIPVDEGFDIPSNDFVGGINEFRKRLALRKVAIPRFRRADHSLLTDIDTLLCKVSQEFEVMSVKMEETTQGTGEHCGDALSQVQRPTNHLNEGSSSREVCEPPDLLELESLRAENESLRAKCAGLEQKTSAMTVTVDDHLDGEANRAPTANYGSEDMEKMKGELTKLSQQILQDEDRHSVEVEQLRATLSEKEALHRAEMEKVKAQHLDEIAKVKKTNLGTMEKVKERLNQLYQQKEEALAGVAALQVEHEGELKRLVEADRLAYQSEITALKEKLERQENDSRAEKEELCKMLQESSEEVLRQQEAQEKLRLELDSLRPQYEKDMGDAAARFAASLSEIEAKKTALENEMKQKEKDEHAKLRKIRGDLEELEAKHAREKSQLQDELVLAHEVQRALKSEISKMQADHAKEKETIKANIDVYQQKEAEIKELKKVLEERAASEEEERLKKAVEDAESKYREEIRQLREELFWEQESQRQLKSEISEMEASHAEELEKTKIDVLDDFHETNEAIVELQEKLQQQERYSRDEKEELCNMFKSAEEAHEQELQKLKDELQRVQEAHRQVKSESIKQQAAHAEEIEKLMTKTLDYCKKDDEIETWKEKAQNIEGLHRDEKERLRGWLKNHLENVRNLKEEFGEAQQSHIVHLLNILSELDTMQSQRDKEVESIMEELEIMGKEKDEAILALQAALEVHQRQPAGLPTIAEEADEMPKGELNDLQALLQENSLLRSAHLEEFNATMNKLQMAVKPSNLKYILRKIKKNQDSGFETKVLTEIHRLSTVLGEIYTQEDRAQQHLHEEVTALCERFSSATEDSVEQRGKDGGKAESPRHERRRASIAAATEKQIQKIEENRGMLLDPMTASTTRKTHKASQKKRDPVASSETKTPATLSTPRTRRRPLRRQMQLQP